MATDATVSLGSSALDGREVRLRPRGLARFPGAAFLAAWLCGWAAGEVAVAYLLVRGAITLVTGQPPGAGESPLEPGPALATGAFLVCWLALWTAGGVAAIHQLLKLVWSEDRIAIHPGGLTVVHRIGPFRSTRDLPRATLRRVYVLSDTGRLHAETASGSVELASLGTPDERMSAAEIVRTELGLEGPAESSAPDQLPPGWQEIIDPEGGVSLVRNVAVRRRQSRVAGGAAAVVGAAALLGVRSTARGADLAPVTTLASVLALGLAWIALALAHGRTEWRVDNGRLLLRRRFGSRVRELFAGASLELTSSRDSDGDSWFTLEAVAEGATASAAPASRKARRQITRAVHDPTGPRRLGRWLAARAGLPSRDLATEPQRAADLAAVAARLEGAGLLGRLAARLIRRSGTAPRPS